MALSKFTLFDAMKSRDRKRNSIFIEFQSLPEGIKELQYFRSLFFIKNWYVSFQGTLDLARLNNICKEKNYILMDAEETGIEKERNNFRELFNFVGKLKGNPRLGDEFTAYFEPNIEYYIFENYRFYEGRKIITRVSCYEHKQEFCFRTFRRKGLELAEEYRRS